MCAGAGGRPHKDPNICGCPRDDRFHRYVYLSALHTLTSISCKQGVTMRCRLSMLTNSAPHTSPNAGGGGGGVVGSQPMSTVVHIT